MWAVIATVSLPEGASPEDMRQALVETAVPAVGALNGLVDATWTISDDRTAGVGIYRFRTEADARARAATIAVGSSAPGGATVAKVDVLEVLVEITG